MCCDPRKFSNVIGRRNTSAGSFYQQTSFFWNFKAFIAKKSWLSLGSSDIMMRPLKRGIFQSSPLFSNSPPFFSVCNPVLRPKSRFLPESFLGTGLGRALNHTVVRTKDASVDQRSLRWFSLASFFSWYLKELSLVRLVTR
jgi:hypothetical protein